MLAMPCASQGPSEPGVKINDLLELHTFTAGVKFKPRTKAELVAAVIQTEQRSRSLRAIGTNFSLSAAAVADDVIDTSSLQMHLSHPFPGGNAPLPQTRIRNGGSNFLSM